MSLAKRATQGVIWLVLKDGGNTLISFVVFTLLARLLSVEDFGLIAAAMIAVSIFQLVVNQGFAAAIIQRKEIEKPHLDSAFWVSVLIGVALCLLLLATAWPIASVLTGQEPELIPTLTAVLQWLSLGFVLMSMQSVPQALLQRDLDFKPLAIRAMISNLAGGGVGVGMAFAGYGVWSLVGQLLATKTVGVILLWRITDWRPALRFSWSHMREIFGFSLKMLGLKLVGFAGKRADQVLISAALGPVALGFYAIASRLSGLLSRISGQSISMVSFPLFSRLQADRARFQEAFLKTNEYSAVIAAPVFAGAALTAPELIHVVFGEKWTISAAPFRWLAIYAFLECMLGASSSVVLAQGRAGLRLAMSIGTVVTNVVVYGAVIAAGGGILAVAIAAAVRGYAYLPVWLLVIRHVTGVSIRSLLGRVVRPVMAALLMSAAVVATRYLLETLDPKESGLTSALTTQVIARLAIMISVGVVTYSLAIAVLWPSLVGELRARVAGGFQTTPTPTDRIAHPQSIHVGDAR